MFLLGNPLEALLDQDSFQTQEELARRLGVTQRAISHRLKSLQMIQEQGNWVPYELTPRNVERRFSICEMLLPWHKRKDFMYRIVTGDGKWIHYDNQKRKKSWGSPGHASTFAAKQNIHGKNSYCVFGRISLVSCIMSCSNRTEQFLGLSIGHN